MPLSVGIVGLPNVGKSTLFQALTKNQVDTSNYPFATIDPNVGVVAVPDERIEKLALLSKSAKVVPTTIEFYDIAGLVKGASKGEGLGNKFLSHIREVDAICHVVRSFEDPNVVHVAGKVDPESDRKTILYELAMADLEQVIRILDTLDGKSRTGDKEAAKTIQVLQRIKTALDQGQTALSIDLNDDERKVLKSFNLLTMKPVLTVLNVDEKDNEQDENLLKISVKLEAELASFDPDEASAYLNELGWKESGLTKLIKACYGLLGLITYFTTGEDETRAWTIEKETLAPQAAGAIHTDFEKGFIRAEVINWKELLDSGSEASAKSKGLMRMEGKEYVFQDGDVAIFHFS
ncbi:redox-regulated ATPase YchF [Patescibacteria group bacterium]|nr:redox-regulated ATPase YchF [Patescibacteria group bacterium]MBU1890491.1 redox-regulated ATPase YchF [Patescibacteria group bacterium]